MMTTDKIRFYVMAAMLMLMGCAEMDDTSTGGSEDGMVPVRLTLNTLAVDLTRAAVNLNEGPLTSGEVTVRTSTNYNNAYIYVAGTGGRLTSVAPAYYPEGAASIDFVAYTPADDKNALYSVNTVSADQSTKAGYTASDLLWGRAENKNSYSGNVAMSLTHKMAKIIIKVTAGKDVKYINSITLKNVKRQYQLQYQTGVVSYVQAVSGTNQSLIAVTSELPNTVSMSEGAALIPPQTLSYGTQFVYIDTDAGSANFTIPSGGKSFVGGNCYTINITVNRNAIQNGDNTITSWTNSVFGDFDVDPIADQTYTGSPITPPFSVKYGKTLLTENTDYELGWFGNVDAGAADVVIKGKGDYSPYLGVATFTIKRAPATITYSPSALTKTYGDADFNQPPTITGDGTVEYSSNNTKVATINADGDVSIHQAGSAVITAVARDGKNYTYPTDSAFLILTVDKKSIASSDILLANETLTYTGSALTRNVTSVAGLPATNNWTVTGNRQTNAGNYTMTVTMASSCVNYKGSATQTWSIAQAPSSISNAPTAKTALTYNGQAQTLVNAGAASGGTMRYKATTENIKPASTSDFREYVPTGLAAGTYYVWYYVEGDANHSPTAIADVPVPVAIGRRDVSITARTQTVTYGTAIAQNTAQIAATGLANGHSVSSITLTASGTNVPGGTITPSNAAIKDASGQMATDNYQITYVNGNLVINPANSSYTAPTARSGLNYTGSAQTLVNAGSSAHGTIKYATSQSGTYSTTIPSGTNAGSYSVWWKLEPDANHKSVGPLQVSNVSIGKASPNYSPPTARSLTYTGSAQALVYAGSSQHGTIKYATSQSGNFTTTIPTGTSAGTYNVWWRLDGDANHNSVNATRVDNVSISKARSSMSTYSSVYFDDSDPKYTTKRVYVTCTNCQVSGVSITSGSGFSVSFDGNYVVIKRRSSYDFSGRILVTGTGKNNYEDPTSKTIYVYGDEYEEPDLGVSLSQSKVGYVVTTDGMCYTSGSSVPRSKTAAGMVVYKSGSHGLVLALHNMTDKSNFDEVAYGNNNPRPLSYSPKVSGYTWVCGTESQYKKMWSGGYGCSSLSDLERKLRNAGGIILSNYGGIDTYVTCTLNSGGDKDRSFNCSTDPPDWIDYPRYFFNPVRPCFEF